MSHQQYNPEDYITLKDIVLKIIEYYHEVKSSIIWVVIVGLIVGSVLALQYLLQPALYQEKLTFMMDEKSGEGIEGLGIISNLLGGGGKGDENLGKILELFESKKIIHNTLFDTIQINSNFDFLANHILDQYGSEKLIKDYRRFGILDYKAAWPKRLLDNSGFRFPHDDFELFTNEEKLFLRLLYEKINGNSDVGLKPLLSSDLNEDSGIMTLNMKSEYEDVTLGILNNIYIQLSRFFIEKTIEKQKKTYDIIKTKKDSILNVLKISEYQLADFKDRNRSLVTVKGYLRQIQHERDVQINNIMYAEVVRQMEATDFALKNKTPVVQIIDLPGTPIIPRKESFLMGLLRGFFYGCAIVIAILIIRKFFTDIVSN